MAVAVYLASRKVRNRSIASFQACTRLRTFRPHGETPEALRAAKASIPWSSSSAAAVSAPRTADRAEGLVELHREMEVGYCRLVIISTDNITETNEYRSGIGAHWPFLSDTRRMVQKDLDIAEYTDPAHNPMIPHVIVLEPGLVVYNIYNGYLFFRRPAYAQIIRFLPSICPTVFELNYLIEMS